MRLFISTSLPGEVRDHLFDFQSKLKTTDAKVNWVAKKNLHATLKFIGEVSDEKVKEIENKLKNVKFKSFKIKLDKVLLLPNDLFVNVISIGFEDKAFVELQNLVDSETIGFGDLKLGGHITLGRVKSMKNKESYIKLLKNTRFEPIEFTVDSFSLYNSKLNKDSPDYFEIKKYKTMV